MNTHCTRTYDSCHRALDRSSATSRFNQQVSPPATLVRSSCHFCVQQFKYLQSVVCYAIHKSFLEKTKIRMRMWRMIMRRYRCQLTASAGGAGPRETCSLLMMRARDVRKSTYNIMFLYVRPRIFDDIMHGSQN